MATESKYALPKASERIPPAAVFTDENKLALSAQTVSELQLQHGDYFEISVEDGRIVLTPIQDSTMETVWATIAALGITEQDVADAIEWARGRWMW